MPVELRARRARPSYAALFQLPDDEEGAGPLPPADDGSSESAFEPPDAEDEKDVVDEGDIALEYDNEDDGSDIAATTPAASSSKSKGKGKAKVSNRVRTAALHRPATVMLAPGLSRPSARQNYALPQPSLNHRHRGIPLHSVPPRTLRLVKEPKLFEHAEMVATKSASEPSVKERVNKAHSHNIGKGPVWELLEDRSWFKECEPSDQTRPTVYKSLRPKDGWHVLSPEASFPYLPSDEEDSNSSSPLICSFGPFESQHKMQLNTFDTLKMADFFPESQSHVFYAGAPVWAMDWCPVSTDELPRRNYKQYLAVAPYPSKTHSPEIGRRVARPSPACIQIWSLSPTVIPDNPPKKKKKGETKDVGVMTCEMVLCLDGGPAHDMKWCPLPAHDEFQHSTSTSAARKLGVLAGAFEDGSLSLYAVPDPQSLPRPDSGPVFVKLEPHLRIELDDTSCWSLDWANSDLIAVGCTNGSVAVFRVKDALNAQDGGNNALCPSHYIQLHQSAVRAVSWVRAPPMSASGEVRLDRDPTVIVSGGYDGAQLITDIRDRRGNIMNRARDVVNTIAYSHHVGGPLAADNENTVKNYNLAPSMLGRGHALMEPSGAVWSISTSDFHPQIAVGSADGACQTTNLLKSTRRGGAVPFFIQKIFQMDFSRNLGEFRMLENFLPLEHHDRPSAPKTGKKQNEDTEQISTGAWSPEVAVTRVAWQSGSDMARSPLLASATASGLCRIDWLLGRFANNRFPYKNIEYLRREVEGAEDVEEEEE